MVESTQHKLDRVRPPRVQITYDVEIGDAIEMKELPLVVGILADLSGKPEEALPRVSDRKFVEIDRDNFNGVLGSIHPRLAFRVPNRLRKTEENGEDGMLNVELRFKEIDDFSPARLAGQVEPLKKLLDARQRLVDLLAKLDGNDPLDSLLQDVVSSTESLQEIKQSLGGTEEEAEEAGEQE
jgi:type VI secretion system protein ImpB